MFKEIVQFCFIITSKCVILCIHLFNEVIRKKYSKVLKKK